MMEEQKRQEELQAMKRDIFESLHCALPGTVVSFDADSQTAVIRPAVKRKVEQGDGFSQFHSWNERTVPDVPRSDPLTIIDLEAIHYDRIHAARLR